MKRIALLSILCLALLAGCVPAPATPVVPASVGTVPPENPAVATAGALPPESAATGTPSAPPVTQGVETAPTTHVAGQPVVKVVRSGGFAGRTEAWAIYEDGRIVQPDGSVRRVSPALVARLLAEMEASGLFAPGAATPAGPGRCRDCYNYDITVSSNGQTSTLSFVEDPGAASPAVMDLLGKITALIRAGR